MKQTSIRTLTLRALNFLTFALLLVRLVHFQATQHWLPDLMANFVFQYMAAAFVLALANAAFKNWRMTLLALAIAVVSFVQMYTSTQMTAPVSAPHTLTVVQFNAFYKNQRFDDIARWLAANKDRFDIVILQEATDGLVGMAHRLDADYPYMIEAPARNSSGMIVLSRLPLESQKLIELRAPDYLGFVIRIVLRAPGFEKPVTLYSLHAMRPTDKDRQSIRNRQLQRVADIINKDKPDHTILAGDWNMTPYSPYYRKLRDAAGLREQRFSLLPPPTWPAWGLPWLLQIPIDHILTDPGLTLADHHIAPSLGSDHLPVIVSFAERQANP